MAYKAIDLHCDSVFSIMEGKDLTKPVEKVHVDLPRMRKGNVGLQVFAVFLPPVESVSFRGLGTHSLEGEKPFDYTTKRLEAIKAFANSDDLLTHVETAAELEAAMAANKTGIMSAIENGLAIDNTISNIEQLRKQKVRLMTLVHSEHLSWVESCTGSVPFCEKGKGITEFGEKVVDAMNDCGIVPDLSHASENAFWDVIKRSKKPVIVTHSNAFNLCASPRNLKDDQLKALGDSGGVVGVNFFSAFLSEEFRKGFDFNMSDDEPIPDVKVPFSLIADHIDYMVKMAGEDSVGLGSDFDGIPAAPIGVTGSDFYPLLEEELRSRGYPEKRIEKIFNANFLRLFKAWD